MKGIRAYFVFLLSLFMFLQPVTVQAAYIDSDYNVHLKPGKYEKLGVLWGTVINPEEWIESGNYFYVFPGEQEQRKYITIRKIKPEAVQDGKLTIPKYIDGYRVLGLGEWDWYWFERRPPYISYTENAKKYACILDEPEIVKQIIVPEGVEYLGTGSLFGCSNLTQIDLPDSLVKIADLAFDGCANLEEIEFPPEVYVMDDAFHGYESISRMHLKKAVIYSDSYIDFNIAYHPWFQMGEQTELYIRKYKTDNFFLEAMPGYIKKLYVDKKLSKFQLERAYYRWDYDYSRPLDYNVSKLIMNGKDTTLKLSEHVKKPSLLYENDYDNSGVKGLYTVKGAKSIKEARKYKVPYCWKTAGKIKEVKAKKKGDAYWVSWEKIKTSVHKCVYKVKREKWDITTSPVQTIYKIYGKKKKSGSYHFIKTTKKKSISSGYKYIKVVPLKEWD